MQTRSPLLKRFITVVAAVCAFVSPAHAQSASTTDVPLIPIETLLARPQASTVQVSPDGSELAVLERVGTHPAIVLYDRTLQHRREIHRDTVRSISNVRWSGDGRWLLMLHDRGGDEGYHLWRIDPRHRSAQQRPVDLTPFTGAAVDVLALPVGAASAIIESNHRDPRVSDAYRLDLVSARLTRLASNPGDITSWVVDRHGRVVGAAATRSDGTLEIRVPGGRSKPWLRRYSAPASERMTLLGVDPVTRNILLRTNRDRAAEEYVRLDPVSGRVRPFRASTCVGFDAGSWQFSATGDLIAESCVAEAPRFVPVETGLRRLLMRPIAAETGQTTLTDPERALELESASANGRVLVLYTHAATDPGQFVLVDRDRDAVRNLVSLRASVPQRVLARTRFVWFTTRDGLRLSMLVTRSTVQPEGRQPVVVVAHGGPWTRDALGYSPETQFLANRGYAVLQVNFRGSTGLGKQTVDGAIGEFGGRMSDDLLDALQWASDSSGIDASRACILGGSYGGFAALVGMTRDATHYRCGVDYAGPFDLETLIRAFPPSWQPFLPRSWYRFVGNPKDSVALARMRAVSPLALLHRAQAPLLVFQGANDPRVRTEHALQVTSAWRARSLPVTLLLASNEGHSFNEETTALAVQRSVEEFLARWLGGRRQPSVSADVTRALSRLIAAGDSATASARTAPPPPAPAPPRTPRTAAGSPPAPATTAPSPAPARRILHQSPRSHR